MSMSSKKDISFDLPILDRKRNLVNNEFQSDVTFVVGEQKTKIHAHKLLLMLHSEYFYAMFNGNFKETNEKEVDAMDIEPEIFLEILKFIYCGEVDLAPDNILDIYIHSEKFMIPELHSLTTEYLHEKLNYENVLRVFSTNRSYELDFINEHCLEIISKNPLFLFKHEDFYVLDKDSLKMIFECKDINCTIDQMKSALENWKKTHENDDIEELESILEMRRDYKSSKLLLFGEKSIIYRMDPAPFKFILDRDTTLFGVGIYVDPKLEPKSSIYITINEASGKQLQSAQATYDPKEKPKTVQVMDIFFEALDLVKDLSYQINITFSIRPDEMFGINCIASHAFLTIDTNRSQLSSVSNNRGLSFIAHIFYEHSNEIYDLHAKKSFSFNGFSLKCTK